MSEPLNVKISLCLFNKLMFLMEYLSLANFDLPNICKFNDILFELRAKQQNINKHSAYSQIIYAKDDEKRNIARRNYVKLKNDTLNA